MKRRYGVTQACTELTENHVPGIQWRTRTGDQLDHFGMEELCSKRLRINEADDLAAEQKDFSEGLRREFRADDSGISITWMFRQCIVEI